jgi:non-heme chloroperoxidase
LDSQVASEHLRQRRGIGDRGRIENGDTSNLDRAHEFRSVSCATSIAVAAMPLAGLATERAAKTSVHSDHNNGDKAMNTVKTNDGIYIFYKDWGKGQPIVFSHGWPLSADDWDAQMMFFLNHGFRVIAHDRRGHGRSTQTADGHDMDHYADDLAAVTAHLDLKDAIHVGHSTGGGEVVRYLARHGESRVAKAVLISAVPPLMVKTDTNPGGLRWISGAGRQQPVAVLSRPSRGSVLRL